jgi:precorrin-6Y C5,15-methyltransferase (decarboxylating)
MAGKQAWLTVIGVDDGGPASLPRVTLDLIERAELVVGGARHHEIFPDLTAERLCWASPITRSVEAILARRGRPVVVLASGDPLCFGIGRTLADRVPIDEMRILPGPSSAALARARLGWAEEETRLVSVHARPLATLRRHLAPGTCLIVYSHDETTPASVASLLRDAGYGPSRLDVFERLGGPAERHLGGSADDWTNPPVDRLNVIAVACHQEAGTRPLSTSPGLPDAAFAHDGMLTKREVRAITLARLEPHPGQLLIDVGAGSGSIAIEWLRAAQGTRAVAVERDPARRALIAANAESLGVPELEILEGEAPACLGGIGPADAVFVGGGVALPGMLETCRRLLRAGGRLVANAVTIEAERALMTFAEAHPAELTRIEIARAEPLGSRHGWRPAMPVTQLVAWRP